MRFAAPRGSTRLADVLRRPPAPAGSRLVRLTGDPVAVPRMVTPPGGQERRVVVGCVLGGRPGRTRPGGAGPRCTGPGRTGPGRSGPGRTRPRSTGPRSTGPRRPGPRRTRPRGSGPRSTGPRRAGPGRTGPGVRVPRLAADVDLAHDLFEHAVAVAVGLDVPPAAAGLDRAEPGCDRRLPHSGSGIRRE